MATRYTAFIWPPSVFPLPVLLGKIGPAQVSPVWPKYPPPSVLASATSKIGGTAAAPNMPSMVPPTKTTATVSWTPAAPPATPNTTSQNTVEVQASAGNFVVVERARRDINTLFRIVSPTPGSGQ